jgi:hypothetical protein
MPIFDRIFRIPFSRDFFRFFWLSFTLMSGTCGVWEGHGCIESGKDQKSI